MPRGLLPFSIGTIRERRPLTLVFIAALARPLFGSFMPDTGHQQKSSSYRRSVNEQNISVYLSEINVTVMNTPYFIRLFFSVDWILRSKSSKVGVALQLRCPLFAELVNFLWRHLVQFLLLKFRGHIVLESADYRLIHELDKWKFFFIHHHFWWSF